MNQIVLTGSQRHFPGANVRRDHATHAWRGSRRWGTAMRAQRFWAVPVGLATVAALGALAGGTTAARAGKATAAASIAIHPNVIRPRAGTFARATPPTTADCKAQLHFACYQPGQIQQAYGLPKLYSQGINGAGQTIVIVDAYGSPTIRKDLATFDRGFGLPALALAEDHPACWEGPARPPHLVPASAGPSRPRWTWSTRTRRTWRQHLAGRVASQRDRGHRGLPADRDGRGVRHQAPPR